MFTIFSVPKKFEGNFGIIQRNAITSWTKLMPRPEIILFGDEAGTSQICQELKIKHVPKIKVNVFGTPILDDIFKKAKNISKNNTLAFILADIIFLSNLSPIIDNIKKSFSEFLLIGKRYEAKISKLIDFRDNNWRTKFINNFIKDGYLKGPSWMDYFIFNKNLYDNIPPFAIGRTFWDKWLVWHAVTNKIPVIDGTPSIIALHQSHDYSHVKGNNKEIWEGKEAQRNIKLAGGWSHGNNIKNATYIFSDTIIIKNNNIFLWINRSFRNVLDKFGVINPILFKLRRIINRT